MKRPKSTKAYKEALEQFGEAFLGAFEYHNEIEAAIDCCKESYQGCFRNLEAYAEDWMEQTGSLECLPEPLRRYFSYSDWGRDCLLGGDIFTYEGSEGLHVYSAN